MGADPHWWSEAVIYQVYLKSFADSNGDGIGDLAGLIAHLDHLVDLGVDGLWLNPCYVSPDRDGGYDVADYLRIDDVYGGNSAFEALIEAAHKRGLRVLMDIVPNHCSNTHPWFQKALAGIPDYRERFLFRNGRGPSGELPPNNWKSVFGGPAWTRVADGQWYLHAFDASQPDFNWRHPAVREYFSTVLRYWFDRGVDGFRIDVATRLIKAPDLPDYDPTLDMDTPDSNQPEVHDIYRQWRRIANQYGRMFVGEVWVPTAEDVAAYLRGDELHQAFYFDLVGQPWNAQAFAHSVRQGLRAVELISEQMGPDAAMGSLAWTLSNHDVHRTVSRLGLVKPAPTVPIDPKEPLLRPRGEIDVALGTSRAHAALLFLLGLPGAVYLYQGEELGLPEVLDLPDEARRDPIWFRSGGTEYGRDGCRVPLPWTPEGPFFGFSTGTPWLPQPEYFGKYAVASQLNDPNSTLSLYRTALAYRNKLIRGTRPHLTWLEIADRDDVIAYRRHNVTVVTVFGDQPFLVPDAWGQIVLTSAPTTSPRLLPGASAAWLVDPTVTL